MNKSTLLFLLLILMLTGCEKSSQIEGLWIVSLVQVGDQTMTPNARWTRFNSDHTQESGNGRFEHSYGTWSLDRETHELSIKNTNGLDDLYDPFKVSFEQDKMIWKRNEEGQDLTVTLERSSKLPETYGDKALGLWELENASGGGTYFGESESKTGESIHFRWDKRFVIRSRNGKVHGVYNVHGHKSEVELIPYGEPLRRDFWKMEVEQDQLTLTLLNSEENVVRKFKRTYRFPDD